MNKSTTLDTIKRHVGELSYREDNLVEYMLSSSQWSWIEIVRAINSIRELKEVLGHD